MRWYIIRALLHKEFARHMANRGGIALALLLVAGAVLLSVFTPKQAGAAGTDMVGGVHHCYVVFPRDNRLKPLRDHLRANRAPELQTQLMVGEQDTDSITTLLESNPGTGVIMVWLDSDPTKPSALNVSVWHPKENPEAMAVYEDWFWKELRRGYAAQVRKDHPNLPADPKFDGEAPWTVLEAHANLKAQAAAVGAPSVVPDLNVSRKGLAAPPPGWHGAIATGMVMFALYFACVYLLPTLNCEERERGVLLAQALSPASPVEILAAKFLFYPAFGLGLGATLAAIVKPDVLSSVFFWLSLFAVGGGFMGIGMTIAALAKTQRAAFLGGMCYLLSVSMILLICSINHIPFLSNLAVEYHGPRILYAALSGADHHSYWLNLLGAMGLAVGWLFAAAWVFRRRGWQ
jgi:hypothetical protein